MNDCSKNNLMISNKINTNQFTSSDLKPDLINFIKDIVNFYKIMDVD